MRGGACTTMRGSTRWYRRRSRRISISPRPMRILRRPARRCPPCMPIAIPPPGLLRAAFMAAMPSRTRSWSCGQRPADDLAVRGFVSGGLRGRSVRPGTPRHRSGECERRRRGRRPRRCEGRGRGGDRASLCGGMRAGRGARRRAPFPRCGVASKPISPPTNTKRAATRDLMWRGRKRWWRRSSPAIPTLEGQRHAALFELAAVLGRTPAEAPRDIEACRRPPQLDGTPADRRRRSAHPAPSRRAAGRAAAGRCDRAKSAWPRRICIRRFAWRVFTVERPSKSPSSRRTLARPGVSVPRSAGRSQTRPARAPAFGRPRPLRRPRWRLSTPWCSPRSRKPSRRWPCTARRSTIGDRSCRRRIRITTSFDIAKNEFLAGGVSNLDVLTTEQSLVALNASVASADAEIIQDQIAVFKALGGGWREDQTAAK